jgi:glycine hydroxymethyltransferase
MSTKNKHKDSVLFGLLEKEFLRQRTYLGLIASENFASPEVMQAMASVATNKYAEGYPPDDDGKDRRFYAGCEVINEIELLAIQRAKELFKVNYANVQPHSGSQANAAVFLAIMKSGEKFLGLDLPMGGHLTHGSPANFSGKTYHAIHYGLTVNGLIDYAELEAKARAEKPKMIICGSSAYSRDWDYERIRAVADEVGAVVWADIAHPAGLIAAGLMNDPFDYCHIVTSTTHKTLRGPRGGIIMLRNDFENPWGIKTPKGRLRMMSSLLDSAVFPGSQGGPLENIIAAKAVGFGENLQQEFRDYGIQVIKNAKAMADAFIMREYYVISNGTENHLMLIDLRNKNVTGKTLQETLNLAGITLNRNSVPFDDKSAFITSGIRIGTAGITTRGMKEEHMGMIVNWIDKIVKAPGNARLITQTKDEVQEFLQQFPLYPELG